MSYVPNINFGTACPRVSIVFGATPNKTCHTGSNLIKEMVFVDLDLKS